MNNQTPPISHNYYRNLITGATLNPLITNPDAIDEEFATAANGVLHQVAEVVPTLIGVHQAAIAIIVQTDWSSVRKYFSLSAKYAAGKV
jgi:hypothetical protein